MCKEVTSRFFCPIQFLDMLSKQNLNQLYFRDTQFVSLMTKRIYNVLIIANPYDAFVLEDDGRIDEKVFNEYTSLSLRYPPRFWRVTTEEEAIEHLEELPFELIICMPGLGDVDSFAIGRRLKKLYPDIAMIILTPFSHGIRKRIEHEDLSAFDSVFCWLGNTDLLLSIIKLFEDRMNLDHDVREIGLQVILLVEDGIRYYSSILPSLYKFMLKQSHEFSTEALNAHQQTLRMRGRPKLLLARNYEEAEGLYEKYKDHLLGLITDVSFPKNGEKDSMAGIKLCEKIRKESPFLPIIMQSSETENITYATKYGATFIDKNSKKMNVDLRKAFAETFGFGDFVFRNPNTLEEIARIKNLKELQNVIFAIPTESLNYHISRNHISRWLYSRAMFPLAEFLKSFEWVDLADSNSHRQVIFDSIVQYRKMKNQGVVAIFKRDRFDRYSNFARIGEGSLGGKGRGLAFIDNMLKKHPEFNEFENAKIEIPKTVVLCTDIFDEFMETNNLYQVAISNIEDSEILNYFLKAKLPDRLVEDFLALFNVVKSPIAVRSSSLLEDSHYQPFAGIYNTYMIPYLDDKYDMLEMLSDAIKGVYASVYFKSSKAYMRATSNVIDQEKMAVILQEVVGNQYGSKYYPSMSGVARSLNFYPLGDEKAEEGIVNLALGLGKYVVDGGVTLRFSPYHPHKILQTSELDLALKETQTQFYALDLKNTGGNFSIDDGFNLLKLRVRQAEKDGSLQFLASTYDPYDQVIRDGIYPGGRKVITFANILQHEVFPLANILKLVLKKSVEEMCRPIEIEFAVKLNAENRTGLFYLLQIRPIVENKAVMNEDLNTIPEEQLLLKSANSLGHGEMHDLFDVVYVKTQDYTPKNNLQIAEELEKINSQLTEENKNYVLIGPGRWGSSDSWLGIPVKWPHISSARLIVEAGLKTFQVDPSQGTHFFQNLTSFGVGYFTINPHVGDGLYNQEYLDHQPAITETEHLRHVRFEQPICVKMNGKKKMGVAYLPEYSPLSSPTV